MNETALKIRLFGDAVLRKKARTVTKVSGTHRDILSEMTRLMYAASGVGLAAPQVGINESMIVVDVGSGLYKLINPKIIKKHGRQTMEEGCLSVPGVYIKVKRAKNISVTAQDDLGKPVTIEAQDLLACVFQHEVDHLKGRLIVDRASFFEKLKVRRRLTELKKRSQDESRTFLKSGGGTEEKVRDEELPESKTKPRQLQL